MSIVLTTLVVVATLATVAALALGIMSMVYNGEASPFDDEHWMAYRVILQGVALAALVATFFVGT